MKAPRFGFSLSLFVVALLAVFYVVPVDEAVADVGPSSGSVRGSGAANRFTLWKNFNTLTSDPNITFDGTTVTLGYATTTAGHNMTANAFISTNSNSTAVQCAGAQCGASMTGTYTTTQATFPAFQGGGGGFKDVGVAFASFPAASVGGLLYDATNNCWRFSTGSAWSGCIANNNGTVSRSREIVFAGTCSPTSAASTVCVNDVTWPGGITSSTGAETFVLSGNGGPVLNCGVAGSGGTTAMTVQLWDITAGSAAATDNTSYACNTAAGTSTSLSWGATPITLTVGHKYSIRFNAKGNCTTEAGSCGLYMGVDL